MRIMDIARRRRGINPFILDPNNVTIKLKDGYGAGVIGRADYDPSGKIYTAVDQTAWNALNPNIDDYTVICTTLVTNMSSAFRDVDFNQDITHFDTSNATNMSLMFQLNRTFDQPIGVWDVSNCKNFSLMFSGLGKKTIFNQPLNDWDMSSATNIVAMFSSNQFFNQPLNNWNISGCTSLFLMFRFSPFNQDISNWDVSNVTNMISAFRATPFNQDISAWDVSNVTFWESIFNSATQFNQDLSSWCVEQTASEPTNFAANTPSWVLPKPNWGVTC